MKILYRSLLMFALLASVGGCGKTGPLYLPDPEPASNASAPAEAGR